MAETAAQKRKREKDERTAELAELARLADGEKPPAVVLPEGTPGFDPEVEQGCKDDEYDQMDAAELVADLGGRGLDQETKDRLNAALAETPNDPEVATDLLRRVVKALDRGEELPVPALPAATIEEDEDGDGAEQEGAASVPPSEAPTEAEAPEAAVPEASAEAPGGEPFADLGRDELITLIHEEGGGAALDNLNQAIQFLPTDDTLPYLRRFAYAVVNEDPMPNLEPHLVEEAGRVAVERASKFKITSDDDDGPQSVSLNSTAPPPLQRPELGDEDFGGFRVGQMVRVASSDPESIYNGHVGFIEHVTHDDELTFLVRFHQPDESPGERVPATFVAGALTAVEG